MLTSTIKRMACSVLLLIVIGCAPVLRPDELPIFFPPPPETPRIVYMKSYHGERDFKNVNWIESFLGESPTRTIVQPYGVTARDQKIFVTSIVGNVTVIDEKAKSVSYLGEDVSGRLLMPLGLAAARDGSLFVADARQRKVVVFDKQGNFASAVGKAGDLQNPTGLAINDDLNRLYVVDSQAHSVLIYSLSGEYLSRFGGRGSANGEFNYPSNIAIDRRNGNVIVSDTQNFRVVVFDKDGKYLLHFGGVGDQPGNFARPRGVGVDSEGNIYVVDAAFGNFQVFDDKGQLLTFVGSVGHTPGHFDLPAGLYLDERDRIYVVDSLNRRVQMFQYLSEKFKSEQPDIYSKYTTTASAPSPSK